MLLTLTNLPHFLATSTTVFETKTLLHGRELLLFILTPVALLGLLSWTWYGPALTLWFNHLTFSGFQFKTNFLISGGFSLLLTAFVLNLHLTSQEAYDYLAACYSFMLWLTLLYSVNNLFTLIFFLEILATLVNLLLITSTFSTTTFYNNLNLQNHQYFQGTTPFTFLQTLITYFWISLIAALNLFLFLLLAYLRWFSFEWSLLEVVFQYNLFQTSLKSLTVGAVIWANFVAAFFLKGGIVPFFLWKPTFFKGLPLPTLMFYVTVYYFWLLLFFYLFFSFYVHDLFQFYSLTMLLFLLLGLLTLTTLVFESTYVRSFFAVSSSLNTLLTLLALTAGAVCDPFLLV